MGPTKKTARQKYYLEWNLVWKLLVIMLVSGLFLVSIYQITDHRIRRQQEAEREKAVVSVIPGATDYRKVDNSMYPLYLGLDQQLKPVGYAMEIEGSGFQGTITLMVGINAQKRQVSGIKVLEMAETPGLGARIEEPWFKEQFSHKSFHEPFVVGEDVEAISGATISSEAVARLVNKAVSRFEKRDSPIE